MTTVIDLPFPPSQNRLHAKAKAGHVYLTSQARAWQRAAGWEWHAQRRRVEPVRGPYTARIILSSHGRRGDADNRVKAVLDLLVKLGVTSDDRLCENASGTWDDTGTVPKGRCRVELSPVQRRKAA